MVTKMSEHKFHVIKGVVLQERTNSDTHVYGSIGGGGSSYDSVTNSYRTNAVSGNINSHTTKTQEFWLKLDNGKEQYINLGTQTVPLRSGHKIALVYYDNYELPFYLYIENTEMMYTVQEIPLLRAESAVHLLMIPFIIGIAVLFVGIAAFETFGRVVSMIISLIFFLVVPMVFMRPRQLRKISEIEKENRSIINMRDEALTLMKQESGQQ